MCKRMVFDDDFIAERILLEIVGCQQVFQFHLGLALAIAIVNNFDSDGLRETHGHEHSAPEQ